MKIIYDKNQEVYGIQIEQSETTIILNTDDIVEARKEFIAIMTRIFNESICDKLKYGSFEYTKAQTTNKTCEHEWECCGVSTQSSIYRCKKCYAHKEVPLTAQSASHYKGELI